MESSGDESLLLALLIDGLQAFLTLIVIGIVVNPIISIAAAFALGTSKNEGRILATLAAEVVPGVNALPIWTMSVLAGKALRAANKKV